MKSTQHVRQGVISRLCDSFFISQLSPRSSQQDHILKRYGEFVKDPSATVASLIQNPFELTKCKRCINVFFSKKIFDYLEVLDRMNDGDLTVFKEAKKNQNIIILYLINVEYILFYSNLSQEQVKKKLKKRAPYIMRALKFCYADDLVRSVESVLFEIRHPRLFHKYKNLFDINREKYFVSEKEAKNTLENILAKSGIFAHIQSRTKTMISLHEKIEKKNILPSQIFDLIGLRVLTKTEGECYRVLELLLSYWSVEYARVKDYIAVPKENGYQSIHVSGKFENICVEIQIRTYKMHHKAQYGTAAHHIYKDEK